jgi:hypothetical protein
VAGVILPGYFNRKMEISAWENITHVWWPALLGSAPGIAVITAWKYLAPPDSWLGLFAAIIVAGLTTCVAGWFLSLQKAERRTFFHVAGFKPTSQETA